MLYDLRHYGMDERGVTQCDHAGAVDACNTVRWWWGVGVDRDGTIVQVYRIECVFFKYWNRDENLEQV